MQNKKYIAYIVLIILLVAIGWFLRGLMPSGAPIMSGANMMNDSQKATYVTTANIIEIDQNPMKSYVGHVKAMQDVKIYAQIPGVIQKVHFKEGSIVKQGDLLFTIDPKEYEAEVQVKSASLEQAKADLNYAELYYKRLKKADARSVVQDDVDKAYSDFMSAQASYNQAKANLETAKIDLSYTKIVAPIDGRIGKAELTKGDYVNVGSNILAELVQVNPIRVQISLSDRDYYNLEKEKEKDNKSVKIQLRLANNDLFSKEGTFDFLNNKMNQETGTITAFINFDNSDGVLIPDAYVTVLIGVNDNNKKSLVVPQTAIMTDEKGEYVYVVNNNIAQKRHVILGDLSDDNRIVKSGLSLGENVVVKGLLQVKAGQKVSTQDTKGN